MLTVALPKVSHSLHAMLAPAMGSVGDAKHVETETSSEGESTAESFYTASSSGGLLLLASLVSKVREVLSKSF